MEHDIAHVVVISGGQRLHPDVASIIPSHTRIVAADSGWDRARDVGLTPHVLVGDMDSISPDSLRRAETSGVAIVRHPVDKDFTDLELALAHAATLGNRITLLSGGGGRLDHSFAEITALTAEALRDCDVDAIIGRARVHIAHEKSPLTLDATIGSVVSIIAIGARAIGVSVSGCKWNLSDENLSPHESRGLSNVVQSTPIAITVTAGHVAVVEPFFLKETP